jgi:hypothetical protein
MCGFLTAGCRAGQTLSHCREAMPQLRKESGIAMKPTVRARFWAEAVLAWLSGFLAVLTLFWRNWIEAVTRTDPDRRNGSLEWPS